MRRYDGNTSRENTGFVGLGKCQCHSLSWTCLISLSQSQRLCQAQRWHTAYCVRKRHFHRKLGNNVWVECSEDAINSARDMLVAGVDVVDIGGQSTRPGAEIVSEAEELDRVIPVIECASCGHALCYCFSMLTWHTVPQKKVLFVR